MQSSISANPADVKTAQKILDNSTNFKNYCGTGIKIKSTVAAYYCYQYDTTYIYDGTND